MSNAASLESIIRSQVSAASNDYAAVYASGLGSQADVERKYRQRLGQRLGGFVALMLSQKPKQYMTSLSATCASRGLEATVDEALQMLRNGGMQVESDLITSELKKYVDSKQDLPRLQDFR